MNGIGGSRKHFFQNKKKFILVLDMLSKKYIEGYATDRGLFKSLQIITEAYN